MWLSEHSKNPVIIPAFNEEQRIARTLASLDASSVEPIVVVNGSSDRTAEVARRFTNNVIELKEQGKLPAIQAGLRSLGETALHGVIMLDADSQPVDKRHWDDLMTWPFAVHQGPIVTAGSIRFGEGSIVSNTVRSLKRHREQRQAGASGASSSVYGANMAVKFSDPDVLDEFMSLENIWPGEDRLTADLIIARGGVLRYVTDRHADVRTSARFLPSLTGRLLKGRNASIMSAELNYLDRTPPAATASYFNGTYVSMSETEPDIEHIEPAQITLEAI